MKTIKSYINTVSLLHFTNLILFQSYTLTLLHSYTLILLICIYIGSENSRTQKALFLFCNMKTYYKVVNFDLCTQLG